MTRCQPLENEHLIVKSLPNSFLNTDLERKLKEKGITKVVVMGMMTHMCMDATVRAAVNLGYDTTLIEDACAILDLSYQGKNVTTEQVHYAFVGALDAMYCEVTSTESFLQQLIKK